MATCEITPSAGGWRNDDIAPGASIDSEKVIQRYTVSMLLTADAATAITAMTMPFCQIHADSAELISFKATAMTAATGGGDRVASIDLQKSTAAGAFATVLTSEIDLDNSVAARLCLPAVILDESAIEDDVYQIVVTLAGSTGTHAKGVLVTLAIEDRF